MSTKEINIEDEISMTKTKYSFKRIDLEDDKYG
jgi:hypothetical protein